MTATETVIYGHSLRSLVYPLAKSRFLNKLPFKSLSLKKVNHILQNGDFPLFLSVQLVDLLMCVNKIYHLIYALS